jgi:hypothetical protein
VTSGPKIPWGSAQVHPNLKWIFWTSRHWEPLIDMLSKSSRNSSSRTSGSLGLQIHNNQSMVRVALTPRPKDRARMANPRITIPSHQQRRVMGSRRRTLENGVSSTKSLGTILMNVTPNKSLLAEMKSPGSDVDSDSDSEPEKGRWIIDAEPSVTIATTKVQPEEPEEPEEGECLFHSQMWVKGTPLHFIVDNGSQKNLISTEVFKRLNLTMTQHPQPYTIGWLSQGWDIRVSQQCVLHYDIKPFKDEVLCDVSPLEVCDVFLGQPYMWKHHVVYESRPRSVIITLGDQLYRVPEAVPNTVVSLISVKQCRKVVSQTEIFFLCMVRSEGEWKVTATTKTSAWGLSSQQQQVDGNSRGVQRHIHLAYWGACALSGKALN